MATVTKNVSSSAVIGVKHTRDVVSSAVTTAHVNKDIVSSANISIKKSIGINSSAVVVIPHHVDMVSSAAIRTVHTNSIVSSAVIKATQVKNLPSSASISTIRAKDLSTSASIGHEVSYDISSSAVIGHPIVLYGTKMIQFWPITDKNNMAGLEIGIWLGTDTYNSSPIRTVRVPVSLSDTIEDIIKRVDLMCNIEITQHIDIERVNSIIQGLVSGLDEHRLLYHEIILG